MNVSNGSFSGTRGLLFFKHILRKLFLEDWALKVIAILITFALWYGVSLSSKKGTATMAAQLAFRVRNDTVLTSAGVQNVTIRIAGDDDKIDQLLGTDVRVTADLTQLEPGEKVQTLTPQNVSIALPAGVRLEDVQPSRIAVKLEAVEERDLPVLGATVGEPAAGYEVYSTTVTPAKVRASGPESIMATLVSIPTGAVDIGGAKSDITARQVPISISNPNVTVFNTVVDVAVTIGEKRIERTFVLSADGKRVTAVIYGARSLLSKTRAADLKVDIRSESGSDVPELTLPDALKGSAEVRQLKIG